MFTLTKETQKGSSGMGRGLISSLGKC